MKYKLVATDLDGTLLDNKGNITNANLKTLQKLSKNGIEIVICSGRMLSCILPKLKSLSINCPLVAFNGCMALGKIKNSKRKLIYNKYLEESHVKDLIDYYYVNKGHNVNLYNSGKIYSVEKNKVHKKLIDAYREMCKPDYVIIDNYEKALKFKTPKLVVLVGEKNLNTLFNDAMSKYGHIMHVIKGQFFIEFLCFGVNKATALKELIKSLKIDKKQVVGLGDYNNDSEFLEFVGYGIAMKQGSNKCKKSANKVSEWTNEENAVSRELEILWDQNKFDIN